MLIITRKKSETIKIADNVEVKVLSLKGDKVRIGITAPDNVPVHRSEIYYRTKSQLKNNKNIVAKYSFDNTRNSIA